MSGQWAVGSGQLTEESRGTTVPRLCRGHWVSDFTVHCPLPTAHLLLILLALLTFPLVGHGCHGDDIDHEPAAAPPAPAARDSGAAAKSSPEPPCTRGR